MNSNQSEPVSLNIKSGDKMGILYIDEINVIGLTQNGIVKGKFDLFISCINKLT